MWRFHVFHPSNAASWDTILHQLWQKPRSPEREEKLARMRDQFKLPPPDPDGGCCAGLGKLAHASERVPMQACTGPGPQPKPTAGPIPSPVTLTRLNQVRTLPLVRHGVVRASSKRGSPNTCWWNIDPALGVVFLYR